MYLTALYPGFDLEDEDWPQDWPALRAQVAEVERLFALHRGERVSYELVAKVLAIEEKMVTSSVVKVIDSGDTKAPLHKLNLKYRVDSAFSSQRLAKTNTHILSMKTLRVAQIALLLGLACSSASAAQAADLPPTLTIVCEVYQMKTGLAQEWLTAGKFDTGEKLSELRKKAQKEEAAVIAKLPAITTKSGARAESVSGQFSLEVEPVASPKGDAVDLNVVFKAGEKRLSATAFVKPGGVMFVGSVDGLEEGQTFLVFATCLLHP